MKKKTLKIKTSIFSVVLLLFTVLVTMKSPDTGISKNPKKGKDVLTAKKKASKKGFKSLFNGRDFNEWKLLLRNGTTEEAKKVFTIDKGGILHFYRDLPKGSGNDEARRNAFHGVMATKKSFSKYHLKFEYKWGEKLVNNFDQFQYDAGVFYHIMELKIFPIGLQYQVRYNNLEDKNHSGDFVASGVKMQWYSKDGETFTLPSEGGNPQPIKKGQHYASTNVSYNGLNDEWNECEIIVMDDDYALHFLNGKLANMATDLEPKKGPIAFEAETGEIFWRNIKIKEFEEYIPMENFLK